MRAEPGVTFHMACRYCKGILQAREKIRISQTRQHQIKCQCGEGNNVKGLLVVSLNDAGDLAEKMIVYQGSADLITFEIHFPLTPEFQIEKVFFLILILITIELSISFDLNTNSSAVSNFSVTLERRLLGLLGGVSQESDKVI